MLKEILQGRPMRHPLHPMIVHLPIGLWVASLFFDIFHFLTESPTLAAASFYCIAAGLIGAVLAVPPGVAEYIEIPANTRPKRIATAHMLLNLVVAFLYLANLYFRYRYESGVPTVVSMPTFIFSIAGIIGLSISGFLGGLLVYSHAIGFRPETRDTPADHREAA